MNEKGNSLDRKSKTKTKRRTLGAKSGRSRDFSTVILNSKHTLQQALPSDVHSARSDFISSNSDVETFQHDSDNSSEESEAFSWVKISCTEPRKVAGSKTVHKETKKEDSCCRSKLSLKSSNVEKQTKCDDGNTETFTYVDGIGKHFFEYEHNYKTGEVYSISKCENKSFNDRSHEIITRRSAVQTLPKSQVNTAWQMDQSLTTTDNCPINNVWKVDDAQCENKNFTVKSQTLPKSLNSESFPPLIAAPQHMIPS